MKVPGSTQCGKLDVELGVSTFSGQPDRGGWRPVLLKIDEERSILIDWLCPKCDLIIYYSATGAARCLRCGLGVKEIPIEEYKSDPVRSRRLYQWGRWAREQFETEAELPHRPKNYGHRRWPSSAELMGDRYLEVPCFIQQTG
jgi:hypothetical protein